MRKFNSALIILALFISSSISASSVSPSIIINGVLPEKKDIFSIKYKEDTSEVDLANDSKFLNILNTDNSILSTGNFQVFVGNYTANEEIHNLKFSTVGFRKMAKDSDSNTNKFEFADNVVLPNDIFVTFNKDSSSNLGLTFEGYANLIKGKTVVYSLSVSSGASYPETGDPGYTFNFSWDKMTNTVSAGDYVAQITVEYSNGS